MSATQAAWWLAFLRDGGLLVVFAALFIGSLYAYVKRWIVPGWLLTERDRRICALESEVAQWRKMALDSIGLSARFASAALPSGPVFPPTTPTTPPTGGG